MRVFLLTCLVQVCAVSVANAGLLVHLKLDDGQSNPLTTTAVDSSGSGNDGTLENFSSPPPWISGVAGGALDFATNNNNQVRINQFPEIPINAEERTLSMWINPDGYGDTKSFSYGGGGAGNSFDFTVENVGVTGPSVRFRHGGGNMAYPFGFDPIGQWTHVLAVVPAGASQVQDLELYINGILTPFDPATQNNPTAAMSFPQSDIIIGRRFSGGGAFDGQIDDVQFYNMAIDSEDALYLYNNPGLTLDDRVTVPEPATAVLGLMALGGLGTVTRRRRAG